jgi:Fe-S-cluster containining protein
MGLSEADIKQLPDCVHPIKKDAVFKFACHKDLDCFTECCRLLELTITPYDMLRLRRATGLNSTAFLHQYVITEESAEEFFPHLFLTMLDDGRASCPFVSAHGCTVYPNRPGACRAYPLGRACRQIAPGRSEEDFILVREPHCHGFTEEVQQTTEQYCSDQGLAIYNKFNDIIASLLKHPGIHRRGPLEPAEKDLFMLLLYDTDQLRTALAGNLLTDITPITTQSLLSKSDEDLLLWAVDWLKQRLFS